MPDELPEHLGPFDHYARLVRRLIGVPVGLVSIVEDDRQVFPGAVGLPEPWQSARETPLSHSFCQYVVKDQRPLVVGDARTDPRLADNLAIEDLSVIAYAGFPITDHSGHAIGSLCAIDSSPREWTREEVETLADLASACSAEWNERELARAAGEALAAAEALEERSRVLLGLSEGLSSTETIADVASAVARVSAEMLGCERGGMWLRDTHAVLSRGPLARAGAHETLRLVEDENSTWLSASTFSDLPLDASNPLGGVLLGGSAQFFSTRAAQNEVYPQLANPHQLGEARAFIPLTVAGQGYGALALVWPQQRTFSDEDRVTFAALATYTAQAVSRAQLLQDRLDVAWTMQRALLTELPRARHLQLVARYLPAAVREQVGGDWYDAVVMPDGAVHVMIGDVEGHDVEAAATMGQLRSMLRMAAWLSDSSPCVDLQRLDQAMPDMGISKIASAILARIEQTDNGGRQGGRTLRWSNAGHLPPLLVTPASTEASRTAVAEFLGTDTRPDPILGVDPHHERHTQTAPIRAGTLLLLYTDGLVERRGQALDESMDRLRRAATAAADLTIDAFLDSVLDAMGARTPQDDVAVLAIRFDAVS